MQTMKLQDMGVVNLTPEFLVIGTATLILLLLFLTIYYLINIGNVYIESDKRIRVDLKVIINVLLGIIVLYIFRIILRKFGVVADTLWAIFFGAVIAFVINPIVTFLETKNIKRKFGVLIVYVSIILIFGILMVIVIPKTVQEITNLLLRIPVVFEKLGTDFGKILENLSKDNSSTIYQSFDLMKIADGFRDSVMKLLNNLQNSVVDNLKNVGSGVGVVFSKLLRIVLMFIFAFYFTVDKDKFKNSIVKNLPRKYKEDILYLSMRINQALLNFVKGRLLLAFFVGFFTMIYLLILRVDFAIVIGIITMIADIIPFVGPFMGFVPAVLFAFIVSPFKALWVAILFVLLQWAENNILAPKLIGDKTGLNPILVLISILIGGGVFGVLGMILSVPVFSIILILVDYFKIKYNEINRDIV
ncbi:Predicted PurR-regulated permease PerM [Peptoniphilus asaccharolyticus DSM 20463]|uniref:Predicted PurR-regulated permease PerM n=2 Tax=Peptoniphilus asaccharolyticus TaxID=1258 RepID=A0A1W1UQE9_PEPAS|nr:Predicted PurR-regulated permease PerM [Peptoniphilus asaccharolyticus DSM 20463]